MDAGLHSPKIVHMPGTFNLRAVKLDDRVILFVNGQQRLSIDGNWPASQVGLITENASGSFSGMTYQAASPLSNPS